MGFLYTPHDLKDSEVEIVPAADPPEHRVDQARGPMYVEAEIHQAADYMLDLFFGGALLHDH